MKICTTCGQEWPDEQKFCPNDGSGLRSAGKTADLVGSVVAERYHITKKLGEGGMGAVYLGEHVKMGRKSAIKVMSQSMANDPDSIARFNREAANAARINHPHVCAIYDFGETPDGVIYLAMEFIEGEALTDLIEREGALAPQRAVKIIRQAGEGLQTAHDMGIVHRDLKPDNIMIAQNRDGDVVKVVDFGIAKAMGPEEGQNVTKTGLVVGTPEYMSPEQLSGDKLDGRSDIYSLALVFYRMLTGDLPFQADSAQEVMIKRLTDEPAPLNDTMPEGNFPAALQQVMDRALARMPSERYASAAQFAKDAEAAVSGMPMSAPVAAADVDGATQIIDSAQTAAVAKTRIGGKAKTPDTAQPMASPPIPPRKKPTVAIAAGIAVMVMGGIGGYVAMQGGNDPLATNPPVTQDTAQSRTPSDSHAAPNVPPRNTTPQRPENRPPPETTTVPVPTATTVDTAAILRELDGLSRQYDSPEQLPAARRRAIAIYDSDLPQSIRAHAAANVAESYLVENRTAELCQWIQRAMTLAPSSAAFRSVHARECS
ncbi:MAG: protein kinase [Gemmatimonadales bacterium]